jgi:aldehyde dehydrogenase (NAD+)
MLAWKVAPAVAAGNTVVLKPAEFTPLTALAFAELCNEAELPPGVVNIVTGAGETGALIVDHPDIDKIAFTGSTEVGRIIRQATAGTGKKLSLELGGKSPFIVFDDADLDSAVEGVVDAIWFNQGQVCCAGSRLIVQEAVADKMHDKLRARMATLRVGDPLDKSTDIGAIVADVQLERIRALVEQGRAEGAVCYQPEGAMPEKRTVLSADAGDGARTRLDPRAGGDFRAGTGVDDVPHAGRGARARQQLPLRPRRLHLVGIDQCHA